MSIIKNADDNTKEAFCKFMQISRSGSLLKILDLNLTKNLKVYNLNILGFIQVITQTKVNKNFGKLRESDKIYKWMSLIAEGLDLWAKRSVIEDTPRNNILKLTYSVLIKLKELLKNNINFKDYTCTHTNPNGNRRERRKIIKESKRLDRMNMPKTSYIMAKSL